MTLAEAKTPCRMHAILEYTANQVTVYRNAGAFYVNSFCGQD